MLRLIFTTFLLILSLQAFTQEHPIKQLFDDYYIAVHDTSDFSYQDEDYQEFLSALKKISKKIKNKRRKKELQYIFDKIHEEFLYRYISNPPFIRIFDDGHYNCVTASALFTLVFEYFDIPYAIHEEPTHVYVVAFPDDLNILVESTLPKKGIIENRSKEIEKYRNELFADKVISKEIYESDSKFYTKYILRDSIISTAQLNGIQYYNLAIREIHNNNIDNVINLISVANEKHNARYIDQIYMSHLYDMIRQNSHSNSKSLCYILGHMVNMKDDYSDFETNILGLISEMVHEQPIAKNTEELQSFLRCCTAVLRDDPSLPEITNYIDLTTAESFMNATETDSALVYIQKSYKDDNKVAFSFISYVVETYLYELQDPEKILNELLEFEKKLPCIVNNKRIQGLGVYAYMRNIYTQFELSNIKEANLLLEEFKSKYKPNGDINFDPEIIGIGFGAASTYYVRKNNYPKAKSILNEGLSYAPRSVELVRKLKVLN